jgi:hypothetical protein
MVCEYSSNVLMALSLAINLVRPRGRLQLKTVMDMSTPVRTRNVSQSVACRVVGMTWVINADSYPLLNCRLALRGITKLGHVTSCKFIIH